MLICSSFFSLVGCGTGLLGRLFFGDFCMDVPSSFTASGKI